MLRAPGAALKMPDNVRRVLFRSFGIAAVIVIGWAILGAFFVSQDIFLVSRSRQEDIPSLDFVVILGALSTTLYMLVTPPLLWAAQWKRRPRGERMRRTVLRWIGFVLLFAVVRCCIGVLPAPWIEGRAIVPQDFVTAFVVRFHSAATLGALVVIARVLYDGVRTLREQERRELTLETQLARAQLEQLRGQLQPHFLFNAINGIAALVHTDPARADEMLMELAALLRSTLDLGRSDTIPLRRELELVDHYLRIQSMRFEDRLKVRRTIDAAALGCEVPALLLQPLLENSLRHVIAQRSDGGRIELSARRAADRLLLRVEDDGPGFDPAEVTLGVGISNTIARLEQLYRGDARIDFVRSKDLFTVTIDIPAKEAA